MTKGKQRKDFFTIPEYEQWSEETPDSARWEVKYYKVSEFHQLYCALLTNVVQGLGTSKDADARDYFSHMEKHMIPFARTQEGDRDLIDLAFSKKKADERKEWLRQFKVHTILFCLARRGFTLSSLERFWIIDWWRFHTPSSSTRS